MVSPGAPGSSSNAVTPTADTPQTEPSCRVASARYGGRIVSSSALASGDSDPVRLVLVDHERAVGQRDEVHLVAGEVGRLRRGGGVPRGVPAGCR